MRLVPFQLFAAVLAVVVSAQTAAEREYRAGVELFRKGRLAEAIPRLRQAVRLEPAQADYQKALGVAYGAVGDYASAEEPLGTACRLNAAEEDACFYWARALYALDRFESSLAALEKAAPVDRRPYRVHLAMAQALDGLGRAEQAEKQFRIAHAGLAVAQPALEEDPRLGYGVFLFRQGRAAEALPLLEAAAGAHPRSARARFEHARALVAESRLERAVAELKQALALDPGHEPARLLLAKLERRLTAPAP